MSLEETRARLLTASETAEDLLTLVSDLYVQEIHSKETVLAVALSELHNSGVIDIVKIVRGVDKSSCGRNFFTILHAFENALPTLDARIEDVLHCLVHLTQQAGRDLAIGGIYKAFERYCSEEAHRPRDSVGFILAQSELNAYAPFLSSSILAYGSDCVVEAIQMTESLIANRNEMVRNQAYFTLGRLGVDETKANVIWELISGNAVSENDNDCCASILRATLHLGEKFPSYWPQIEEFLITFVERGSTEVLYIISNIAAFQRFDLPKSVLHLMVKQLTNVSSEHKGIIDNIDHLLVKLVERGESSLAVELLESILAAGVKFKTLDYFSNELISKYQELRNHIITKWLLYGEVPLCHNILDLLHDATGKEIELKAEMTLLDNEVKQVFVSRKVIGWLFTRPISTASFILSISEFASTNTIKELEDILYYPLLLSYPGELKRFFQSCIDNGIQKYLCERLLAKYKSYHADIENVFEINELKAPNENLSVYWKDFDKSMQKAHEEASKSSFIRMLAKTQVLLYGNSSIYYMHQGDGKSVRQEMQMQTFSHSTEMPRLNVLDPVSLDYFLMICRCEIMKNEINY
ncbi:hypothetical protein [Serratia liquefaciens]|jgi:hypothetical protein|uniref:hypothetical protein n=1 Tax=Serratia liquefaciens TaxID=614 RepID=UPI002157EAEE|nr:hypothetical protein [Serratia liquefaciens]CAI1571947.1 Uncharacterised protein [Serratia liquefaciens]